MRRHFPPTESERRQEIAKAMDYARDMTEIDKACTAFAQQENLPGLLAGIVQEGRLVHVSALGQADHEAGRAVTPETAFRIVLLFLCLSVFVFLALCVV